MGLNEMVHEFRLALWESAISMISNIMNGHVFSQ